MTKVDRHMDICKGLNKIYEQKNHDYGDSFHDTFVEEGMAMARIRLSDKLNRFKKLTRMSEDRSEGFLNVPMVKDESIRDTLLDLANYAIMTVMEMDILAEEDKRVLLGEDLSKMKDEAGVALAKAEVLNKEFHFSDDLNEAGLISADELMEREKASASCSPENSINSDTVFCLYCGNEMTYIPKIDNYICEGCGTRFGIARSVAVQRGDTDAAEAK